MNSHDQIVDAFAAAQTPGYAIRAIENNAIVFNDFGGVKAIGYSTPITDTDLWHIGSCTKSMTSFLIGILIDSEKISFESQISSILPGTIANSLKDLTVLDLLTHRAGLPEVTELKNLSWEQFLQLKQSTEDSRESLVSAILLENPKFKRDTKFEYCNSNYVILGAILEEFYQKPWEQIIVENIFAKLGMNECGFGPPATKDLAPPDQPWGHKLVDGTLIAVQPKKVESEYSDNPAALGPAGTVHCSFNSWSLFLKEMLASAQGASSLLTSSTAKSLFSPYKDNVTYGGWGHVDRDWAKGATYMMVGSNELNYAMYVIAPQRNMIFMGATNSGAESALVALSEQFKSLTN